VGPTGNTGPQGPIGVTGAQGIQGVAGSDGIFLGKFNKSTAPISFATSRLVTSAEVFHAGIFIATANNLNFTLPSAVDLLSILPGTATIGDVITFLLCSNTGTTTIVPGTGGSIVGPTTVKVGITRVVYVRFTNVLTAAYVIY
jgi:hypothetical protein